MHTLLIFQCTLESTWCAPGEGTVDVYDIRMENPIVSQWKVPKAMGTVTALEYTSRDYVYIGGENGSVVQWNPTLRLTETTSVFESSPGILILYSKNNIS